eukprot:1134319-Pelagomonas_calceolata.AAC.4
MIKLVRSVHGIIQATMRLAGHSLRSSESNQQSPQEPCKLNPGPTRLNQGCRGTERNGVNM